MMKKFINTIKELIKYCTKKPFKDLLKLLSELLIIALIVAIFKLPFIMIRDFGIELITSMGLRFSNIILLIWNLGFDLSYLVIGIIIYIHILNKRYNNINETKKDL